MSLWQFTAFVDGHVEANSTDDQPDRLTESEIVSLSEFLDRRE